MKSWFTPKYFFWFKILLLLLILYLGEASNIVCLLQPQYVPIGRNGLHGSGQIYFIPLETFPAAVLKRFVSFYRNKYGVSILILPALPLPHSTFNEERRQFVAEELMGFLQQTTHDSQLEAGSTIIALTDQDLYIRKFNWRYAFSFRSGQMGIVSSARMDHRWMGVWPIDSDWQETRLRKMVTKDIGVLYYHLPLSSHCQSPVFGRIGGPQELDFMGEDL
jgi:predicted Zn-dependent protease